MNIGLLTAPVGTTARFEEIARWASRAGFKALEVTTGPGGHLAAQDVLPDKGQKVRKILTETGLRISGLAYYSGFNWTDGVEVYSRNMKEAIAMAQILKADAVCTFVGMPAPGKSRIQTIRENAPAVFNPLIQEAEKRKVKIAFENWYETNLRDLDCFKAVTEVLPQSNVGFNFDPSHLARQGIDYLAAVAEFKDRIFHTHAKDVTMVESKRGRCGVLENAWWEFTIPGYGAISWGEYIRALRLGGYDGVLSIEHEDRAFNAKEGFEKGLRFLSALV